MTGTRAMLAKRPRITAKTIRGKWRIVETEMWDQEALDLVVPAYIDFGLHNMGQMQLIAIGASVDYRVVERDGEVCVEFSWDGFDEGDSVSGRGWAALRSGRLEGKLFIHQGDESSFVAERRS
jgi:hypothetical protein